MLTLLVVTLLCFFFFGLASSRMVLAQNAMPSAANIGHSNVYAQLRAFPLAARRNCHRPSHSMPATAATVNACQASHLGAIRNRHRDLGPVPDGPVLDITVMLAP